MTVLYYAHNETCEETHYFHLVNTVQPRRSVAG